MHIGIDVHMCRLTQTGLYSYIWNVLQGLQNLEHPHRITLFLYGQPGMEEPESLRRVIDTFSKAEVQYVWDDLPLKSFSSRYGSSASQAPRWVKQVDRKVLFPMWKKMQMPDSRLTLYASRLARRLYQASTSLEIDVFHHPAGLVFPVSDKANVMTLSDLIPRLFPYYCPGSDEWFKESFDKADQMDIILTYSEHTKQDVAKTLEIDEERIRVIPLAAHHQYRPLDNQEQVQAVLMKHGLGERPYIIYVGSVEARKNVSRLVEAYHLLRQEEPSLEHQLVLVGTKLWLHESIFEVIRNLDLESHVKWLGYVPFEDLPALLNGAELFAFPSLYEGFGLPHLEAMSCGTPVICSRASSLPEVVGDAGLMFDPYRVKDIAEAMHRTLTDSQLRLSLREKGLKRSHMFSWDKTARATLAAYEEAWTRFQSRERQGQTRRDSKPERPKIYKHAHGWVVEQLIRQSYNGTDK